MVHLSDAIGPQPSAPPSAGADALTAHGSGSAVRQLIEQYALAFKEYCSEGGEAPLRRAYELGRRALGSGLGVLEGRVEIHTEFYDPIVLEAGESIYIDSNMGHAYVAAEGCNEATVIGICSSADDGLMQSLMSLHADEPVAVTV